MPEATTTTRIQIASPQAPAPASGPQYRDAYRRALPAAQALPVGELITINIDVPTVVTTVIGKLAQNPFVSRRW